MNTNTSTTVQSLSIESITLMLDVPDEEERHSLNRVFQKAVSAHEEDRRLVGHAFEKAEDRQGYQYAALLHLGALPDDVGGMVVIRHAPFNKTLATMKVTWNPARLDRDGRRKLWQIMNDLLPEGYRRLVFQGTISRMTLAVMIDGVTLEDLCIWSTGTKLISEATMSADRLGLPKEVRIGALESPIRFRCLNAPVNTVEKGKGIRLEVEMQKMFFDHQQKTFRPTIPDLRLLPNPFADLEVRRATLVSHEQHPCLGLFLDSCRLRGTQAALLTLPPKLRTIFAKTLINEDSSWWQPDLIWHREWRHALRSLNPTGFFEGVLTAGQSHGEIEARQVAIQNGYLAMGWIDPDSTTLEGRVRAVPPGDDRAFRAQQFNASVAEFTVILRHPKGIDDEPSRLEGWLQSEKRPCMVITTGTLLEALSVDSLLPSTKVRFLHVVVESQVKVEEVRRLLPVILRQVVRRPTKRATAPTNSQVATPPPTDRIHAVPPNKEMLW